MRYADDRGGWHEIGADATASMNFWGFTLDVFDALAVRFDRFLASDAAARPRSEFQLPTEVGALIREDAVSVKVLPTTERWFGVTYREDRPLVKRAIGALIEAGVYPERLWE